MTTYKGGVTTLLRCGVKKKIFCAKQKPAEAGLGIKTGGALKSEQAFLVVVFVDEVGCIHETIDASAVKATAFEFIGQYATVFGLLQQGVGQLDFAVLARLGIAQDIEDIRREI